MVRRDETELWISWSRTGESASDFSDILPERVSNPFNASNAGMCAQWRVQTVPESSGTSS